MEYFDYEYSSWAVIILLDLIKLNWLIWGSLMRSYYCRTWEKIMVQYDYIWKFRVSLRHACTRGHHYH